MNEVSSTRADASDAVAETALYTGEEAWTVDSGGAVYAGGGRRVDMVRMLLYTILVSILDLATSSKSGALQNI